MQQLPLNITFDCPASLDNFVVGQNAEILAALREFVMPQEQEPLMYLWGGSSSGKTHLLKAVRHLQHRQYQTNFFDAKTELGTIDDQYDWLILDNAEQLSSAQQIQLFSLINRAREGYGRILCAGNVTPAQLPVRTDLSSRLAWHAVYHLHALSDAQKQDAVIQRAEMLGFTLALEHIEYLMRHWRRDLSALLQLIDRLDEYSRVTQRAITLPLLREVLAERAP